MISSWEIFVPITLNEKDFSLEHHQQWDNFVRKLTNGLTIRKKAKGQWINPRTGGLTKEEMIPVMIACTREQMEEIINFTLEHYDQEAVMAYKISDEVITGYRKK